MSSDEADNNLNKLMIEKFGADILNNTDFNQLQGDLLGLVCQIIQKKHFLLEDKFIVENAMALWMGCVLHQPELFKQFAAWKSTNAASSIKNADEFILGGVLFCDEEKIRQDFCITFTALSRHFSAGEYSPLKYVLGLLAKNFENISDRPAR